MTHVIRGFLCCAWLSLAWPAIGRAQPTTLTLDGFGQTYRPAGLLNLEARTRSYPWLRAETQVWLGASPSAENDLAQGGAQVGDVVVLAVHVREPEGRAQLRAGRFVLSTGAVRPIHLDGGHVRLRSHGGTSLEVFAGSPVLPRFASREYDWLVGGRAAQRLGERATVGVSYLHRRDFGEVSDEEVGVDALWLPTRGVDVAARASYDLTFTALSEVSVTASRGHADRRVELFGRYRDPSRILPATSLFTVLSQASSSAGGVSGSYRWFPRLRVFGEASYRHVAEAHGAAGSLGGRLALDPRGESFFEGTVSRQHVSTARWTALRGVLARDLHAQVRAGGELELVAPDDDAQGALWPWGRLWVRWKVREGWLLAGAVEGSASPQFTRLFTALLRLSYTGSTS